MEEVSFLKNEKGGWQKAEMNTRTATFERYRCRWKYLLPAIGNDFAQSICADKNGEMWFGMADGSVYTCKGQAFEK